MTLIIRHEERRRKRNGIKWPTAFFRIVRGTFLSLVGRDVRTGNELREITVINDVVDRAVRESKEKRLVRSLVRFILGIIICYNGETNRESAQFVICFFVC